MHLGEIKITIKIKHTHAYPTCSGSVKATEEKWGMRRWIEMISISVQVAYSVILNLLAWEVQLSNNLQYEGLWIA